MTSKEVLEYYNNKENVKWKKVVKMYSSGIVLEIEPSIDIPIIDSTGQQIYVVAYLLNKIKELKEDGR